jgi:hypothetical protein
MNHDTVHKGVSMASVDGVVHSGGRAAHLVTIECSRPGDTYTPFESGTHLDVHLAGPGATGGTGAILCGFDRFARDEEGRIAVGFSVGGGVTGPGYKHHPCPDCASLVHGRSVAGTHKCLFTEPGEADEYGCPCGGGCDDQEGGL